MINYLLLLKLNKKRKKTLKILNFECKREEGKGEEQILGKVEVI